MRKFDATDAVRFIGGPRNGQLLHGNSLVFEDEIDEVNDSYNGMTLMFDPLDRTYAFCIHKSLRDLSSDDLFALGKTLVKKLHEGMNYMDVFSMRKDA